MLLQHCAAHTFLCLPSLRLLKTSLGIGLHNPDRDCNLQRWHPSWWARFALSREEEMSLPSLLDNARMHLHKLLWAVQGKRAAEGTTFSRSTLIWQLETPSIHLMIVNPIDFQQLASAHMPWTQPLPCDGALPCLRDCLDLATGHRPLPHL